MHLISNTIHLSCRCNNQRGYFLLFFCHGRGRMSESNAQITAAILIETSEWIPKVYTERIATDTFSLGQPHYYFLRLWKGKGLTDLLEATLVIPPPVHSYCHRMRHLSPTHTVGKQFCHPERRVYFCCVRDAGVCIWFIVHFPMRLPPEALEFPAQRACLGSLSFQQK